MTPQRFAEIDRLLSLALEREPDERASFVERTCGADAELRHELETLLKCHERPSPFLAEPSLNVLEQFIEQEKKEEDCDQDNDETFLKHDAKVGRYQVIVELGTGGMGCVYAAYDPELDRKVAIKLMRPEGLRADGGSEGRARLLREAQAMARLSHPNVMAVHDVGTHGSQVFIAMEYVEGSTLARWLTERKRSWREVVSMFVQAGRGLAAAHAAGIVHRDFKPENVLVDQDGRARVFDFGLARSALLRDIEKNTDAAAQSTVDRDVPISGAMLGAAVTEAGKVLGTPEYMAPEQLMGEVGDERADQFSFCVALYQGVYRDLPFERDRGVGGPLLEHVKQGMVRAAPKSSGIPSSLRRILLRGLSFQPERRYASMNALLEQLAREPTRLRRRSFTVVGSIIVAAVGTIWLNREIRTASEKARSTAVRGNQTPSDELFAAYTDKSPETEGRVRESIEYFEGVLSKDPNFAPAHAALAKAYILLNQPLAALPPRDAVSKARAEALTALQLDDSLAEAHTALGRVKSIYDWDWFGAEREFRRALELKPKYMRTYFWYGQQLMALNRMDDALALFNTARQLDPKSPNARLNVARWFAARKDYKRALQEIRDAVELNPTALAMRRYQGAIKVDAGLHEEGIAELQLVHDVENSIEDQATLAYAYAAAGRSASAEAILQELDRNSSAARTGIAFIIAEVFTALGRKETALDWLERAFDAHAIGLLRINYDPRLDPLRSEPRFQNVVRRMGLPR